MRWDEANLEPMQAVTPAASGEKTETPDAKLRRTLKISEWNPGLTLLYFHTPHEDLTKDKLVGTAFVTLKQCKTFRDEQVARWLGVYHCVEVDMSKSDAKTAERLGAKDGAIFAVIDQDMNVIATTKPVANSEGVVAFLKGAAKSEKSAKHWSLLQTQLDEQKATLEKARELAAQKKFKESLEQYDIVLGGTLRIGEWWDDAAKESVKVRRKAASDK